MENDKKSQQGDTNKKLCTYLENMGLFKEKCFVSHIRLWKSKFYYEIHTTEINLLEDNYENYFQTLLMIYQASQRKVLI